MDDTVTYSMWYRTHKGEEIRASLWDSANLVECEKTVEWMNHESQADYRTDRIYFLMEHRTTHRALDKPADLCQYDCSYCHMED